MLMYLLYHEEYELLEMYKEMFPTEDGSAIGSIGLNDLVARGFIVRASEGDGMAKDFMLTDKFTEIYADKFVVGEELWSAYPSHLVKEDKTYPLTLTDEDELREKYWTKIKGMREEHEEVMKDLDFAKKNGLIQGTIKNFVGSRQWMAFREMRSKADTLRGVTKKRKTFNDKTRVSEGIQGTET